MADNKVNSGLLEFSEDQKIFVALDAETSEVKKAVTIDGDGVETDIQGVQPSGKKEITSTAEVNVASYATAQVVDEDLIAGNIKKDVDILGVVGSYEGGESSDFSTANITVVLNLTGVYEGEKSVAVIDDVITIRQDELKAGVAISTNNNNTQMPVVVYKNNPINATLEPGLNFEITNATLTGEGNSAIYDDGGADLTIVSDGVLTITAVYSG